MNTLERIRRQGLRDFLISRLTAVADSVAKSNSPALHVASTVARYRPVAPHQIHRKPELFMQVCGTTHFQIPGGNFSLRPGRILLVPDGVAHLETVEREGGDYSNLVFMFPDWGVRGHAAIAGPNDRPQIGISYPCKTPHSARLVTLLDCITVGNSSELDIGTAGINALFHGFLTTLLAIITSADGEGYEGDSSRINRCLQIIGSDLHKPGLSVKTLADELNCTADYLSALFKEETGENLRHYINRLRVEHAKNLLMKTQMTASEIAYAVGYRTQSYFSRVFRKYTSLSPGEFRSGHSGG